jgi:hypothetical protein
VVRRRHTRVQQEARKRLIADVDDGAETGVRTSVGAGKGHMTTHQPRKPCERYQAMKHLNTLGVWEGCTARYYRHAAGSAALFNAGGSGVMLATRPPCCGDVRGV